MTISVDVTFLSTTYFLVRDYMTCRVDVFFISLFGLQGSYHTVFFYYTRYHKCISGLYCTYMKHMIDVHH
jgi:hypothetical protein